MFIGRTDVEAETPVLGHLMGRADSFEKTLMLGNPLQYSCLENPGQRSLVGCSPWGPKGSDMTEATGHTQALARAKMIACLFHAALCQGNPIRHLAINALSY